ncbi:MAG: hypothetical protein ACOX66_07535 [Oscillospiraceae bacterium]|jgi:hypothetical protein
MKKQLCPRPDDRGAAMLTVVIAMLFIVVLAVTLLSTSYMGYSVALSHKHDKSTFYSAETEMDLLRAGIHNSVSSAISTAYTDTLKGPDQTQAAFTANFLAALKEDTAAFLSYDSARDTYTYDPSKMTAYLTGQNTANNIPGSVTVSSVKADGTAGNCQVVYTADESLVLKGIRVTYIENGYASSITSDIVIRFPSYNGTAALPYNISSYAIVADTALNCSTDNTTITGSVYAGAVNCGSGKLTFTDGSLFSRGDVTLSGNGSLAFEGSAEGAEFWAENLINNSNSTGDNKGLTIGTNSKRNNVTFVKNDLILGAANASAKIYGSYIGFGGKNAANQNTAERKNNSSSILINGRNAKLDLEDLSRLQLAGVAYIHEDESNAEPIPMGQSIAVKSDQLAYLVPATCLGSDYPTNPYIHATDSTPTLKVSTNVPLWPNSSDAELKKKTLSSYLGALKNGTNYQHGKIVVRHQVVGGANEGLTADCVFIVFTDQASANHYFRDYFNSDQSTAKQYFNNYFAYYKLTDSSNVQTAGNAYTGSYTNITPPDTTPTVPPDDKISLKTYASVAALNASSLYTAYANNSPYDRFLKDPAKIDGKDMVFKRNGKIVAVLSNAGLDSADYPSTAEDPILLISTSSITVSAGNPLYGVAVTKTLTLNANVTYGALNYAGLSSAKTDDGRLLSDYLSIGSVDSASTQDSWNIDQLVTYQNWKKS